MGLFGKKKENKIVENQVVEDPSVEKSSAEISITKNDELQSLINEFKTIKENDTEEYKVDDSAVEEEPIVMQNPGEIVEEPETVEEETPIKVENIENGESFESSTENNQNIEDYLMGKSTPAEVPEEELGQGDSFDEDDLVEDPSGEIVEEEPEETSEEIIEEEPEETSEEIIEEEPEETSEEIIEEKPEEISEEIIEEELEETPAESNDQIENVVDDGEIVDGDEIIDESELDGEIVDDEIIEEQTSETIQPDGKEEVVEETSVDNLQNEDKISLVDDSSEEIEEGTEAEIDVETPEDTEQTDLSEEEMAFYKQLVAKYGNDTEALNSSIEEQSDKNAELLSERTPYVTDDNSSNEQELQDVSEIVSNGTEEQDLQYKTVIKRAATEVNRSNAKTFGVESGFVGEVIQFTELANVPSASWEDVVRRRGHVAYHVTTASNGGWFIKRNGKPNPYAYCREKEDVIKLAKMYSEKEKAELKIHNAKGVIEGSYSFGREKMRG